MLKTLIRCLIELINFIINIKVEFIIIYKEVLALKVVVYIPET